jgi:phage-related protein
MDWAVETLNTAVDKELEALPADMRARFIRISELVVAVGLERVGMPHVKHLVGPLWEMRLKGNDGISRALYVVTKGKRIVVVRVFMKKTGKTPQREIHLALNRAKEVLE